MSCFDAIRRRFRRENSGSKTDAVQDEIVRKLLVELLKPIDEAYGVEPLSVDEIKAQLDKYIERKVSEKIAELKEFCSQVEKIQEESHSQDDRSTIFSGSDMEEVPLDDVTIEVPGNSTDEAPKKKSFFKKIFKRHPKHRDTRPSEATHKKQSLLKKFFKKS